MRVLSALLLAARLISEATANVLAQQPTIQSRGPPSLDWVVDRWDSESGLPQNSVMAITQTRDGYLWLATSGGLVRFDGVRFRLFATAEFPAMRTDRLNFVTNAPGGGLWIGSEQGVLRYDKGAFT